jgi:uncharacterized protein YndB with AHSA1/START domain
MAVEPVRNALVIPLPLERAFMLFTDDLGTWWPKEYTWSGEVLEEIGIEGWLDGMCYETGPYGFRCDWGRVLAWEPPNRLVFTWQISPNREPVPDPRKASEVELRFASQDDNVTRVDFEHRNFERHGPGAQSYRDALNAEDGWPLILDGYVRAATMIGG